MADPVDRLATGVAYLESRRRAVMSRPVTYLRVADRASIATYATVGKTPFRIETADGLMMHVETRDYIITAADLVQDNLPTTPALGDVIDEVIDGVTQRFEVVGPGGEPHCRYHDAARTVFRIHTKYLGPAPEATATGTGTGT